MHEEAAEAKWETTEDIKPSLCADDAVYAKFIATHAHDTTTFTPHSVALPLLN